MKYSRAIKLHTSLFVHFFPPQLLNTYAIDWAGLKFWQQIIKQVIEIIAMLPSIFK